MNSKITNENFLKIFSQYNSLKLFDLIDYEKFYLYSLITHSTAIEGSTVTEIENQLLFDEGISAKGRSITEQMMNIDLKKAYEKGFDLAKNKTPYSTELLCNLSSLVMKNTGVQYNSIKGGFDSSKGDLRLVNVSAGIGGTSYMAFDKVPTKLNDFCNNLNQEILNVPDGIIEKYELSFKAHYDLVTIHPWVDGNGRMSRLVMNMIQLQMGLLPAKILKENKAKYIQSLQDSRDIEKSTPFIDFMFFEHYNNLKSEIETYTKSQKENVVEKHTDVVEKVQNVVEKDDVKSTQNQRQNQIIQMIKENPKISASQMAKIMNKNIRTIQRDLAILQEKNKIIHIGSDKGGTWEVIFKER